MEGNTGDGEFTEFDVSEMVRAWLGDFDMGPSDLTGVFVNGKAPFSWCENHFQFFSLSAKEGLKPFRKEELPEDVRYFSQWFRSGKDDICIEASNTGKMGLPQY